MRNLDSCRCWRCTLCRCKVRNKFLVNFWNRTILLCKSCICICVCVCVCVLVSYWHQGEYVILEFLHSVTLFEACDRDDISCNVTVLPQLYYVIKPVLETVPFFFSSTCTSTVKSLKCVLRIQGLDIPECHKKFIYFGLRDSSAILLSHDIHFSVDYCWWLGPGCGQQRDRSRSSCQNLYQETMTKKRSFWTRMSNSYKTRLI